MGPTFPEDAQSPLVFPLTRKNFLFMYLSFIFDSCVLRLDMIYL